MLYHYTSHEGLIGIVRDKSIWATNVHYLNDSSEFIHALDLFRFAIDLIKLQQNDISTFLIKLKSRIETIREINIFVASFSEKCNLLSQWRAYCSGGGYSIGFNKQLLIDASKKYNFTLGKCIYNPSEQKQTISNMLDEMIDNLRQDKNIHIEKYLSQCISQIISVAPLMKNTSFAEECEWRLISPVISIKDSNISFRLGKSTLISYFVLPLVNDSILHIDEICIGPNPNEYLANKAVTALLSSNNVKWSSVYLSNIPYRSHL